MCEGYSGFRYVNGFEGEAPVRPNLSIGDSIAAIHAALGVALAIIERNNSGSGQIIDVALYEAMFNLMEAVVPEYDGAGIIREPAGTTVTGIVPTNTYRCNDGKYVIIGGNGDGIFKRLMIAAGHTDMASNPDMANNAGRVKHQLAIDNALAQWCLDNDSATIINTLEAERVPAGPIYSIKDIMNDSHYQARGMFEQVEINGRPLKIPAIVPKLKATPGVTEWSGPELGSHNEEVFRDILALDEEQLQKLKQAKVIAR